MTRKFQDHEAYLARAAELEARINAGESIDDVMRADQREKSMALLRRGLEQDAADRE